MSVYRISYRYANSFFQLAEEKKVLKKIADDAELIYDTLDKSRELRNILKSPIIKTKNKKEILTQIFEKKISKDALVFINFIVDKNREEMLYDIMREFLNLRDHKEGIVNTKITSAVELSDSIKNQFEKKLSYQTNKKIRSKYFVDEKIVGGFIVRIEDTVMDASVRHQLELLRKKFSEDISISNN